MDVGGILFDRLGEYRVDQADDRRVVLALEQIRLLSNLETESDKLIQILLLGQPELDAMLESPELRQLRQRIGVR